MSTTIIKPRWEAWEQSCLQEAFKHKIPLKMMAVALGRSVTAVSKKITALNLRVLSQTMGMKGVNNEAKNLLQMINILKTYAPLESFQEGQLALQKGCWTNARPMADSDTDEAESLYSMFSDDVQFDFVRPLDFMSVTGTPLTEKWAVKIQGEPEYVPLQYVEQWAASEGFNKTTEELQEIGLTYWKNGTYFSQTQLLMHVNYLRFEHRLQPIALID